ncbi:MAG: type II toxin-antitoxin system HicB family antitoxin [Desulfovibrio sp.]|nr:type II toxin-antitoxin system HicB family antitoxin [Desulfovibrio sp.]
MRYLSIFIPVVEGGYTVVIPDFPEIVTEGSTLNEAMDMAEDVLAETIDDYTKEGRALPMQSSLETVTLAAQKEMQGRGVDSTRPPLIQLVTVLSHAPQKELASA